ncbi:MAG: hypothetical protein ACHQNE_01035 [Candidatus Kapaibacterium sp.]
MKKEFSFYEFAGILVPSVTFLYLLSLIIEHVYGKQFVDFSKLGESIVFLTVAYGFGHLLQAVGNMFEKLFWWIFGGMPSKWLIVPSRFAGKLFDDAQTSAILTKVHAQFDVSPGKDYGRDVYNWLSLKDKITEKRIDLFNANYGMFRGLTVSFYLLTFATAFLVCWKFALIPLCLGLLANTRMFRFGKLYAQEIYRTFQNIQ